MPSEDNQNISKVFLQPLFGEPYDWTEQYLVNISQVRGYDWIIFTPHKLRGGKNTRIVKMSLDDFNNLFYKKTGVLFKNVLEGKAPKKNLTDYYPAYGHIFEDYFKHDYWGHTNWDCVYGRLSHFLPDQELKKAKIWADESNEVNGTFSLYKNTKEVNLLYQEVEGWERVFSDFKLHGFDETLFSKYAVDKEYVTCPPHYPLHSYDRFPQHIPKPNLGYKEGRLYELFVDTVTGRTGGKEIPWFHFSYTKKWPL